MSSDPRKLVFAIIKFLKSQLEEGQLSGECAEGVEVGIQCLEAAYNITGSDPSLDHPCLLQDIFHQYMLDYESQRVASPEEKAQAETLKNQGNGFMSALNFNEAIICYTKAIKLDPKNAVYYCNRAAASNKLGNFENAIQDCKIALTIDPNYSKAYGRLGLAYSSLHKPKESIDNYRKALELEPDNDSYKANLKMAEEALASSTSSSTGSNPLHNLDLGMIFTNPNLLSMASQMLSNPSMQNMMSNILSGNMNPEGGAAGGGMEVLLQASQQLAQQMESENPALVEQLRRHMGGAGGGGGAGDDQANTADPSAGPNNKNEGS